MNNDQITVTETIYNISYTWTINDEASINITFFFLYAQSNRTSIFIVHKRVGILIFELTARVQVASDRLLFPALVNLRNIFQVFKLVGVEKVGIWVLQQKLRLDIFCSLVVVVPSKKIYWAFRGLFILIKGVLRINILLFVSGRWTRVQIVFNFLPGDLIALIPLKTLLILD